MSVRTRVSLVHPYRTLNGYVPATNVGTAEGLCFTIFEYHSSSGCYVLGLFTHNDVDAQVPVPRETGWFLPIPIAGEGFGCDEYVRTHIVENIIQSMCNFAGRLYASEYGE